MKIEIAARGWQGREWDGYYPDDLPEDWRLDYYANEFFAVLVPYNDWSTAGDDELLEWMEQVSDDFVFYWELDTAEHGSRERLQALLGKVDFAAHWGGVVGLSGVSPFSQLPFAEGSVALLCLTDNFELRPLRQAMEEAMSEPANKLLVVVEATAAQSLHSARDLAQLLGGS
jgi:hypothetical protein